MTIDKAIEILKFESRRPFNFANHDRANALELGIEALKTVRDMRHYPFPDGIVELPGETKD